MTAEHFFVAIGILFMPIKKCTLLWGREGTKTLDPLLV